MNQYEILHEDEDILVVDKLAPIPVQKDKSGDASLQDLLRDRMSEVEGKEAFLEATHRVDRRTSGIVVFARNKTALAAMEKAFREREIRKTYVACVEREPSPPSGTLEHVIYFDRRSNLSRTLPSGSAIGKNSSRAVLTYALACRSERYFFLDVSPETGRHHQIRAQLAAAGMPIRGDLKYGAKRSCRSGRIMLHARGIEFMHPRSGAPLVLTAPFPDDEPLWAVYDAAAIPKGSPDAAGETPKGD